MRENLGRPPRVAASRWRALGGGVAVGPVGDVSPPARPPFEHKSPRATWSRDSTSPKPVAPAVGDGNGRHPGVRRARSFRSDPAAAETQPVRRLPSDGPSRTGPRHAYTPPTTASGSQVPPLSLRRSRRSHRPCPCKGPSASRSERPRRPIRSGRCVECLSDERPTRSRHLDTMKDVHLDAHHPLQAHHRRPGRSRGSRRPADCLRLDRRRGERQQRHQQQLHRRLPSRSPRSTR